MDRRLAAILAADVAGFSALAGRDEDGAVRALKGHLAALAPIVGLGGGRMVKFTGDGFLAEFPSVVAAVSSATAMQRQMAGRNAAQPEALRMDFRMGERRGEWRDSAAAQPTRPAGVSCPHGHGLGRAWRTRLREPPALRRPARAFHGPVRSFQF